MPIAEMTELGSGARRVKRATVKARCSAAATTNNQRTNEPLGLSLSSSCEAKRKRVEAEQGRGQPTRLARVVVFDNLAR